MELYTMSPRYNVLDQIDYFSSSIWTERVYGDGDFQIVVPATPKIITELSFGTRIWMRDSPEVMIVDKQTIKNGTMTVEGKSLTQNLNCRFFRYSANPADKSYSFDPSIIPGKDVYTPMSPGKLLQFLVTAMAINLDEYLPITGLGLGSDYLQLNIPDFSIGSFDDTLPVIPIIDVAYGPLFDVLKDIAKTYFVAQRIEREGIGDIRYKNWRPVDRTADSKNLLVRFSPSEDNFGDTTELVDGSNYKTHVYAFADSLPASQFTQWQNLEGIETAIPGRYTGFDLRAGMVFASDSNATQVGSAQNSLRQIGSKYLVDNAIVSAIDGTIRPGSQYEYGKHYRLGDIVETQGTSGIIQKSRVTEYIRAQDTSGERAYPTLQAA